jgi:hypothetical protein
LSSGGLSSCGFGGLPFTYIISGGFFFPGLSHPGISISRGGSTLSHLCGSCN